MLHYPVSQQINGDTPALPKQILSINKDTKKSQPQSLHFTQMFLQEIAENYLEFNHIVLTNQVIYIKDISELMTTPFNILIFLFE